MGRGAPVIKAADQEPFLQAARLAEARIGEVAAAMSELKAENDAFRDRLEAQLSDKYEDGRQRLLVSSVQTLETLDRAIDAARQTDAAEALMAGMMLVRTQLFRILQEEGLERVSVLGLRFDPSSSDVVERRPITDADQDGIVLEEVQAGHQLRGRLVRRAKVVVGEYAEDEPATVVIRMPSEPSEPEAARAPAASEALPASEVPPADEVVSIEPIAAMPALHEEPIPAPRPPTEEAIVVEEWTEPPPLPARRSPTPPAPDDDDDTNVTMVLGDAAALLVRPPPPVPAPTPVPPPIPVSAPRPAATPTSARTPGPPPLPPKKTPVTTPVTTAAPTPPRLRTGSVRPPPRDRTPVYEQRPVPPVPPAPPVPPMPAVSPVPPALPAAPVPLPSRDPAGITTDPGLAAAPRSPGPPAGRRGFYVGLSAVIVVLLGALGFELWLLAHRRKSDAPAITQETPTTTAPTGPTVAPPTTIQEEVTVVTPPAAAATAAPAIATPPSGPAPASTRAAAPGATPPPPIPATSRPPAAVPTPALPRAVPRATVAAPAAPANPVPGLLALAEQAVAGKKFDEAITRYNEVLKLEPQNAEAMAGKLRATGDRASMGRYFLTAVTMSEGKASGGGIKGFDGGNVVKSQCECALMYEVTPPNPVQGQPYTVSVFLRNDSKKDIKPQNIAATVTVNGTASSRPVTLIAKDIAKGQRVMVGKIEDTWRVGTTSWSMEAAVGAGGNTYRAQLTWELRVPSGQ